jgi:hypothetical protein
MMATTTGDHRDRSQEIFKDWGARLIRKEQPSGTPRPPSRPPAPGGVRTPGNAGDPGGMVCPGAGGGARTSRPAQGNAPEDTTLLESPAQKILRKPSALGGKSIHLQIVEGDEKGRSFDITGVGSYVIGRKDCDVVLNDEKVSRKHASVIIVREGQYAVQDLASKNGTFVNGVRLSRRNVQHNDLIRVGNTTLRFTVFDGPVSVGA